MTIRPRSRRERVLLAGFACFGGVVAAAYSCGYVNLPGGMAVNFPGRTGEALAESDLTQRIKLPEGFSINTYVSGLPNARMLRVTSSGDVVVTTPRSGSVWLIGRDANNDGIADNKRPLLEGLNQPSGIALHDGYLYVAENTAVSRIPFDESTGTVTGKRQVIVDKLPEGGGHWTRTIGFGPDGMLYVTVGSSCNVCIEEDPRRAAILRYRPDGSGEEIYATGLRNSVGFAWQPGTGELYATDNGRDLLGDDFPPCELNRIEKNGFYGWPLANGDRVPDPNYGQTDPSRVKASIPPAFSFRAHNAPLGIAFYDGTQFPERYRGAAFVALHGSWNRSRKDGYAVVALHFVAGGRIRAEDFVTGFLANERVIGRPVDLAVGSKGELYLSDDFAGVIYRITYRSPATGRSTNPEVTSVPEPSDWSDAEIAERSVRGAQLWAKHDCASCHAPIGDVPAKVELKELATKYSAASMVSYLRTPQPPMPVFLLTDDERRDLAAYLLREG